MNELFIPYKEPEREFRSSRRHFKMLNLDELRPKIKNKDNFELNGQFLKELRTNTFSGSDHEDANEHIEKVLDIVDLFYILNITIDQVMLRAFPMSLTGVASRWLRNEPTGAIPLKTDADAKIATQEMAEYSHKWHNRTSRSRSTKTSNGLAAIQAQLNNLGREIKKVNEKVYATQVGREQCKGTHYTKDFPLKKKGRPMRKLTTCILVDLFKEGEIKQQLRDSIKETM
uniref:Retrotransposon gag domain-containing protein n=1 Tax=Tanacetum cinerariifolium TaxID=118510 RepID=A0A6L2KMR8_TANCI|nr:hypothetical protein [Tanacetum cinerariifolium]